MRAKTRQAAVAGAILLGLGGCGAPHEATPTTNTTQVNANTAAATNANTAPPAAPATTTLAGTDLAQAAALYNSTCASCHLKNGTGDPHHKKDDIPNFTDAAWQSKEPDAELRTSIHDGKGDMMPAFGTSLSSAQIDSLVAYIRTFPTQSAATSAAPAGTPAAAKDRSPSRTATPKPTPPKKPAHDDHGGHGDHKN